MADEVRRGRLEATSSCCRHGGVVVSERVRTQRSRASFGTCGSIALLAVLVVVTLASAACSGSDNEATATIHLPPDSTPEPEPPPEPAPEPVPVEGEPVGLATEGYMVVYARAVDGGVEVLVVEADGENEQSLGTAVGELVGDLGSVGDPFGFSRVLFPSPQGGYVAFVARAQPAPDQPETGGLYIADVAAGSLDLVALDGDAGCHAFAWGREDALFCFRLGEPLLIIEPASGEVRAIAACEDGGAPFQTVAEAVYALCFGEVYDADGVRVGTGDGVGSPQEQCGAEIGGAFVPVDVFAVCAWSRSRSDVVFRSGNRLLLSDRPSEVGAATLVENLPSGQVFFAWAPDDSLILVHTEEGDFVVTPGLGELPRRLEPAGVLPAWWHDADHLAWCEHPAFPSAAPACTIVELASGAVIGQVTGLTLNVSPDSLLVAEDDWSAVYPWDLTCASPGPDAVISGAWLPAAPGATASCTAAVSPAGEGDGEAVQPSESEPSEIAWERVPHDEDVFGDESELGVAADQSLLAVAGAGGLVVALGIDAGADSGDRLHTTWVSRDGVRWQRSPRGVDVLGPSPADGPIYGRDIAAANGVYVIVGTAGQTGAAWASSDGLRWQRAPAGLGFRADAIVAAGPGFIAAAIGQDGSEFWASVDGVRWTRIAGPDPELFPPGSYVTDLALGPRGVVAVGGYEGIDGEDAAVVWTSPEGSVWSRVPHDQDLFGNALIASVAADAQGIVAVGSRRDSSHATVLWYSRDGAQWQRIEGDTVRALGGDGRLVVAALERGFLGYDGDLALSSRDGLVWEEVPGGAAGAFGAEIALARIAFTPIGLVAVGLDHSGEDWDAAVWTVSEPS